MFTDSVLITISGDKISEVVKNIVRIARKGLILREWHDFDQRLSDPRGLGVYNKVDGIWGWQRDYVALLKQFIPEEQIRVIKITSNMDPDDRWGTDGAMIVVGK